MNTNPKVLSKRAIRLTQSSQHAVYMFAVTSQELQSIADVSRISRDSAGKLIGYQRPAVKRHVNEIAEYLAGEDVLFPNAMIISLPSTVRFKSSRGPKSSDGISVSGTLEIDLPGTGEQKPGWIVDGQQRMLALLKSDCENLPVPVTAFVADGVTLQRDQFLRINNARPLPKALVTELLPEALTPLPPRLAKRRIPSSLCDLLERDPQSPFYGIIKRPSGTSDEGLKSVVAYSSVVNMLEESLSSSGGCLFPYRNLTTGETDFDSVWRTLLAYWSGVRAAFGNAWGLSPSKSRLMHGVGIRSMGRLMDRVMPNVDVCCSDATKLVQAELEHVADVCRWTSGNWEGMGAVQWNELQNVPKHIRQLSNYLIRTYLERRRTS